MNEFIEQFLIESRELVTQATDDMLALEETPLDTDRLDSAFRAFHTLKGAAGIVEFDAMGRALHAAENILAAVRSTASPISSDMIGDCLAVLDQVVRWLDEMPTDGALPHGAEAAADAIILRFGRTLQPARPEAADPAGDWDRAILSRYPAAGARARCVLRYAPPEDSFLAGVDPLAILAQLPGLLALDLGEPEVWPALDRLEPFSCRLVLSALSEADPTTVTAHFSNQAISTVLVRALPPADENVFSRAARDLLEAQVLLLGDREAETTAGRTGSGRRVAENVLRSLGRMRAAEHIATVSLDRLQQALDDVLAGTEIQAPAAPMVSPSFHETNARALRVDVERIDTLVNLTGELTVAENALAHVALLAKDDRLHRKLLVKMLREQHAHLARLVSELQHSVLHIRVLPMRQVFQRFSRLVREMVSTLGKPARLIIEGDETEADKAIVEGLFEPLLHVLRNALDHGVETPQARAAAGKPPTATVTLRAARDRGQVVVEVSDDGGGIDVERVRAVALSRGVMDVEALAELPDDSVVDLIFAPGFSTVAEVTSLSGRGVGMDAVRAGIARLGGRVSVLNRPGEGATVRFVLPFTIIMTGVMTVEAGRQTFGIPMEAMAETLLVPRDRIIPIGAAAAIVWRERTIPLINLSAALGRARVADTQSDAHVVVTTAGGQVAGLEVDRIGQRLEVMLKPMDGLLAGMRGIAGTSVLGDGRVLLVLDLQSLLQ